MGFKLDELRLGDHDGQSNGVAALQFALGGHDNQGLELQQLVCDPDHQKLMLASAAKASNL